MKDLFRDLSQRIPVVVYQFLVSRAGTWRFVYLSPQVEEIYEVTVSEALADHNALTSCICEEDRESHRLSVEEAMKDLRDWSHLHRIITPNGNLKWIQAQATPEKLGTGEVMWSGVISDVTWMMLREAELFSLMLQYEKAIKRAQILVSEESEWIERFRRHALKKPLHSTRYSQESSHNHVTAECSPYDTILPTKKASTAPLRQAAEELSSREIEVLKLVSKGCTTKDISHSLDISPATVSAHRRNIKKKIGASSSMEVTRYALLRFPFEGRSFISIEQKE